jgi:hypothetical protein
MEHRSHSISAIAQVNVFQGDNSGPRQSIDRNKKKEEKIERI